MEPSVGEQQRPGPATAESPASALPDGPLGGLRVVEFGQLLAGPYVGTLLGWANMFGNFGAALGPLLLGYLVNHFGWTPALAVNASLYVVSGICWLGIDASVSLVPAAETMNDER